MPDQDDNTLRGLIKGAYDLLEFGHDPVNGSWQIPPDVESVHMAGALLKDALAIIDRLVDGMIADLITGRVCGSRLQHNKKDTT